LEGVRSHLLHVTTGGTKPRLKIAFCSKAAEKTKSDMSKKYICNSLANPNREKKID